MANSEGFDYLNPDYEAVFTARMERLQRIRATPGMLAGLKEHYKSNPVDFINHWGMTFDPRNADIGLPTRIPFVLFPKQAEWVNWIVERWRGREDGLTEKSRDMGISWLSMAVAVWMWLFHPGVVVGFGSRLEEYVDEIGNPKSLFWKGRAFIMGLPKEFRPAGYDEKKHCPYMRIINPENGATIVGEAGDNIGRGNRTSVYFKDESAFYERPQTIDAALSQTSNCKIDISTPNGNGNPFYQKRHGGKIKVFTFHWKDDPRKDQAWYQKQVDTLDSVIVAQEVDIDYNASVANSWISGELVIAAQNRGPADVEAIGKWRIAIDAAHEGNDESIVHSRRGRLNLPQKAFHKLDGPQLAWAVEEHCADLEAAGGEIGAIIIELDGPGVSCYDQLKLGRYKDKVVGLHTGIRLKDGRNYNLRALLHRRAKQYLQDEAPCLPLDEKGMLRAQITSIKYTFKDGLLLMQDKKAYKKEFNCSPDRNDGFILSFADVAETPTDDEEEDRHESHAGEGGWMA